MRGSEIRLDVIKNAYKITFTLENETAFRIGTGREFIDPTKPDNAILDEDGKPIIPGTTLKGIFRSTIESLIPDEVERCAYHDRTPDSKAKREFKRALENDEDIEMCRSCKLFGNAFVMGRVQFSDAKLIGDFKRSVRDGVAIDRDSETAAEGLKYDFEVVEPGARFKVEITAFNVDDEDLKLLKRVVDLINLGIVKIGGMKSRGLGKFKVLDYNVEEV